jgi:hypothetical protein
LTTHTHTYTHTERDCAHTLLPPFMHYKMTEEPLYDNENVIKKVVCIHTCTHI